MFVQKIYTYTLPPNFNITKNQTVMHISTEIIFLGVSKDTHNWKIKRNKVVLCEKRCFILCTIYDTVGIRKLTKLIELKFATHNLLSICVVSEDCVCI